MARSRGLGDVYKRQVEDIAAAVCYLASSESSWVTGECIKVDGGVTHAFL
jgi:NAD(P)-dependent dehydrogenase (short-subunit alcohol dehydrogenase family)